MIRKGFLTLFIVLFFIATGGAARVSAQDDAKTAPLAGGITLLAELDSSLDSKKVKAGDQVGAHTTEAVKVNGKVILPKNTKIVGHVTESSARAKGESESMLAIQLDKALPKNAGELPVRLTIRAMAAAQRNSMGDGAPGQDPMAGRGGSATTSPMGSGRSAPPGVCNAPGDTANSTNAPSGLSSGGQLTPESRGVYGLSGIRIAASMPDAPAQVSVIISSAKNVHLDSGTKLLLVSQAETAQPPLDKNQASRN